MDNVVTPQGADKAKILKHRHYGFDTRNGIRSALGGYVGGTNIAGELVQNADDAEAERIQFYFNPDALVVKNDSYFRDQDFDNILDIASGGKRDQVGRIGTWGTGFLSVYHLTDSPELHSDGQSIRFDPSQHSIPVMESHVGKETVFNFPWRRKQTDLGRWIEAKVWSDAAVQQLLEEMGSAIYRQLLFLRCVNCIEVYLGDGQTGQEKLLYRVSKRRSGEEQKAGFVRERWEIEYQRAGSSARVDSWLYYRGRVPESYTAQDVTIKDRKIAIAFPLKPTEWLEKTAPGTLYNFLPTPIQTGFGFQLNGAFFPDNSRRTILFEDSTQPEKSRWNRQVLESLGSLFASKEVILDIRDQVMDPHRFYELLPLRQPERVHSYLQPIHSAFAKAALALPVVYSSLRTWCLPRHVYIPYSASGAKLRDLADSYMPVLPTETPTKPLRDFLDGLPDKRLLSWSAVVEYLKPYLRDGKRLSATHSMINSIEKLQLLYAALPQLSPMDAGQTSALGQTCLCLAEDETIWTFSGGQVWGAEVDTRRLLADTGIRFVDAQLQSAFPDLVRGLVPTFGGADLADWLGEQEWPDDSFGFAEGPDFIRGKDHLADMLRLIAVDLKRANANTLARLPVVLTEANTLVSSEDAYLHGDRGDRAFLTTLGIDFVQPKWAADDEIARVYSKAGVAELEPRHVIIRLQKQLETWHSLHHQELVSRLLNLYDYFNRQARQRQLTEADVTHLRQLLLCMDQQGKLASAKKGDTSLHLSPAGGLSGDRAIAHLDTLQLQHLVHSDLQTSDGNRFLTGILGLSTLSSTALIEQVILPNYSELTEDARNDLLFYISEQLRNLGSTQSEALLAKLKESDIVRCEDGVYRKGSQVYFASPALDAVFGRYYVRLHPSYDVPVSRADDKDQALYKKNKWHWLFSNLGVNETPAPADLVAAVERQVTGTTPTDDHLEAVRRIYNLLNETEGGKYLLNTRSAELSHLAFMKWLPAANDRSRWFLPSEVYPSQFANYIGKEAPILQFTQTSIELRKLLSTPITVPSTVVAKHLLVLAAEKQDIQTRIYEFLGSGWDDIDPVIQRLLKEAAVVWDGKSRYWMGRHVFLGDYRELYGSRRCCFSTMRSESATKFFQMLGAKESPDGWRDQVVLLKEIAEAYHDGSPVSNSDRDLLLVNFDRLGRLPDESGVERSADALRKLAVIPDRTGRLHSCNRIVLADRADYLDKFDGESVPVVAGSVGGDEDVSLSEAAYTFLHRLGVPRLSEIVDRRVSHVPGSIEDKFLSLRLNRLQDALLRVAISVHEQKNTNVDTQKIRNILGSIKLFACSDLTVEYVLEAPDGWRVQGHRRREDALYDKRNQSLYVVGNQYDAIPPLPLARELERILDLNSKESVIVIEQLLKLQTAEVGDFLTDRGYGRIYADTLSTTSESRATIEMAELGSTEDPSDLTSEDVEDIDPDKTGAECLQRIAEQEHGSVPTGAEIIPDGASPDPYTEPKIPEKALDLAFRSSPGSGKASVPEPVLNNEQGTTGSNVPSLRGNDGIDSVADTDDIEDGPVLGELERYLGATRLYDQSRDMVAAPDGDEALGSEPDEPGGERSLDESLDGSTDEVPAFTGQVRPAVPIRPNDYGRLNRKYDLTRHGVHDTGHDQADPSDDQLQEHPAQDGSEDHTRSAQPVTEVRFILKFANRYEGFLPLHAYARRMFPGRPNRLRCQVEYGEQELDLYVDYDLGLIYNEQALPSLFAAHNIPAGGIVYLKLVHGNVVRLYWNRETSLVRQVRCLEIGEDGTVQEFMIDAAEYPCEIAEFVLRAEKRFEDAEALFKQALDKDGIFETICDVFGEAGRELTYDHIFHTVLAVRMVAEASIYFQLYQRPCFVQVLGGTWRFEPARGYDPYQSALPTRSTRHEPAENGGVSKRNGLADIVHVDDNSQSMLPPTTQEAISGNKRDGAAVAQQPRRMEHWGWADNDPHKAVFEQVLNDWPQIEKLMTPDRGSAREQLLLLVSQLERIARQINAGIVAVSAPQRATDPSLLLLWQQLGAEPQDEKSRTALITYLGSVESSEAQKILLSDLRGLLLQTGAPQREYIYLPILSSCAECARDAGITAWAKDLYELLVEQGAGDFNQQLKQLGEFSKVEEYLEIISQAQTSDERWAWIHEAWNECPAAPKVRAIIQDALKEGIKQTSSGVEQLIGEAKLKEALDEYNRFTGPLLKVSDAWSTSPQAFQVWALAGRLVDALMKGAVTGAGAPKASRSVLVLVGQLPQEAHKFIPADKYLRATMEVSKQFEGQRDLVAAALLLEYALHLFGKGIQNTQAELSEAYEFSSRLYEQLEVYSRAYSHLSTAHSLEVSRKLPYEQTKTLGWRCTRLHKERDKRDAVIEQQTWLGWSRTLLQTSTFDRLVNTQLFAQWIET